MAQRTREDWIAGAFDALCEGGVAALRIEPLARRLGVTKGSFYHHFADRQALMTALLEDWERQGTAAIIAAVELTADAPEDQLRALLALTFAPDPRGDAIESSIRGWAATDDMAADAAERIDERRIAFVTNLLRGAGLPKALAGRRAALLYRTLIGEFIWRSSGGPASTARELDELATLLVQA